MRGIHIRGEISVSHFYYLSALFLLPINLELCCGIRMTFFHSLKRMSNQRNVARGQTAEVVSMWFSFLPGQSGFVVVFFFFSVTRVQRVAPTRHALVVKRRSWGIASNNLPSRGVVRWIETNGRLEAFHPGTSLPDFQSLSHVSNLPYGLLLPRLLCRIAGTAFYLYLRVINRRLWSTPTRNNWRLQLSPNAHVSSPS